MEEKKTRSAREGDRRDIRPRGPGGPGGPRERIGGPRGPPTRGGMAQKPSFGSGRGTGPSEGGRYMGPRQWTSLWRWSNVPCQLQQLMSVAPTRVLYKDGFSIPPSLLFAFCFLPWDSGMWSISPFSRRWHDLDFSPCLLRPELEFVESKESKLTTWIGTTQFGFGILSLFLKGTCMYFLGGPVYYHHCLFRSNASNGFILNCGVESCL